MRAERWSVFVIFAINGIVVGSWAPRMPTFAAQIGANEGQLGLALLGGSIGMIAAASTTGRWCARSGARLVILVSALATVVALPVLATVGSPLQLGAALVLLGATVGMLDVAMNVAAVTVVRRTGRPIMPVFHAGFSFGALGGSMGAAFAAGHDIGLLDHFLVVSALVLVVNLAVIRFVPREEPATGEAQRPADRRMLRRPVLWLLGTIALCSAIVEGASGDWSALFAVRERGLDEAAAAVTFSVFCVAMALVRLVGEQAERRWSQERLLIAGSLTAAFGLLLTAIVPVAALAYVGFALAGGGLAFAFPIALNLAGAVGRRADGTGGEHEIGFVTTIAYSGFLIGPPIMGGVAHLTNLEVAVAFSGVVAALIAPVALAAAAARRREEAIREKQLSGRSVAGRR
ncbi:MFS transporter [Actinophytocola gossypii]|uniref:MFS transporter n=1 Tax=Actinophytocola gossypii TaxID=2812003 RepID=A0ABT2JG78_9PSEU|nr:MFS transporter [Actinophytocola gossypii]MCT2586882.1 MFS transporter [Actinophytocola gossypii]